MKLFFSWCFWEIDIHPSYCVILPGYTWLYGLNYTDISLNTLQDKDMILLLEKIIRGGISYVMGVRHAKSAENKNILHDESNNLYGHSM